MKKVPNIISGTYIAAIRTDLNLSNYITQYCEKDIKQFIKGSKEQAAFKESLIAEFTRPPELSVKNFRIYTQYISDDVDVSLVDQFILKYGINDCAQFRINWK